MDANQFYQSRQADWQALTHLLDRSQRGLAGISPADLDRLGALYRLATSDLALAQRDYPDQRVTAYLNQLVARAHAVIYQSPPLAIGRLWAFVARGFPRAYREALPFILTAMALLIIPALAAGLSTDWQPASAQWLLPAEVQDLIPSIEKKELWTDIPVGERPYASAFIMQNNIQVAFLAFGGGMLAGLFTVYTLIYNGLILGGLTGLTAHYGIGFDLWTFVIGHGVIELSVIAIAGGAGLRLGWAILQPGLLRRRDALAQAARKSVRLVIGCVPLLMIAGTIEGFISPSAAIPWPVHWAVGLGSGALLYGYLLLAGFSPHRPKELNRVNTLIWSWPWRVLKSAARSSDGPDARRLPMTVPTDKTYPAVATNAAWQKKKSFVDKAKSSTKTGLGAALTDAETRWKAIVWANLDPAREKADDLPQAKQHWEAAEAADQKVTAAKNAILLAKKQAQAAATNKYLSKPAQTAAGAIADALQKAQARLDQVDIQGFEKLRKYVEVSSKIPAAMRAGASIMSGGQQIFFGRGFYYHASKSIKISSGEGWRVGGGQVGRVYTVDIGITPEANVDGMTVEVSDDALKAAGIGKKFTLQMEFKKGGRELLEFQAS